MSLSERALIEEILAPLTRRDDGSMGLADDAAFIAGEPGTDLIVTQDTSIGGIHFRANDPPALIARKALRVNLSDLAAKGGTPLAYFLSLGLTGTEDRGWAEAFARGLAADQDEFAIALYGGDTVRSPERVMVTITVCGRVPAGRMVHRVGAGAGDRVYVSGTIGDGALGLMVGEGGAALASLTAAARTELADRYLLPRPRTALAGALREHASAAMDISDGLVGDLGLLTAASGVSAEIEIAAVPLSAPARAAIEADRDLLASAFTGGDDYEILCTVPPAGSTAFERAAGAAGIAVSHIGAIVAGIDSPRFLDESAREVSFARGSYRHF